MDSFIIKHVDGEGGLEFFDRTPPDPDRPIERFCVRITALGLSATVSVYAGGLDYGAFNPTALFRDMAANWRGWEGELAWGSVYCELVLACTIDRCGHVAIRVAVQPDYSPAG